MPLFTTPTVREKYGRHRLFSRVGIDVGITVLKEGGFYRQVRDVDPVRFTAADAAYLGGRTYEVSDLEAASLIAAGYGQYLTDSNGGTYDPSGYGEGIYGTGHYGF